MNKKSLVLIGFLLFANVFSFTAITQQTGSKAEQEFLERYKQSQ